MMLLWLLDQFVETWFLHPLSIGCWIWVPAPACSCSTLCKFWCVISCAEKPKGGKAGRQPACQDVSTWINTTWINTTQHSVDDFLTGVIRLISWKACFSDCNAVTSSNPVAVIFCPYVIAATVCCVNCYPRRAICYTCTLCNAEYQVYFGWFTFILCVIIQIVQNF